MSVQRWMVGMVCDIKVVGAQGDFYFIAPKMSGGTPGCV